MNNLGRSVAVVELKMLMIGARRDVQGETGDCGVLEDVDQRQLLHFLVARMHVVALRPEEPIARPASRSGPVPWWPAW